MNPCTPNYDIVMQKCNSIKIDNESTTVVCIMIAGNKSFISTPFLANSDQSRPPTIQDLLETLNNILIIDDDSADEYSVMSSPGEHGINTTVLN